MLTHTRRKLRFQNLTDTALKLSAVSFTRGYGLIRLIRTRLIEELAELFRCFRPLVHFEQKLLHSRRIFVTALLNSPINDSKLPFSKRIFPFQDLYL